MQYIKHKTQITQERQEYDLTTNSVVYATNDFIIVRWQQYLYLILTAVHLTDEWF